MKKRKEEILEMAWTNIEKGRFTRADIEKCTDERISADALEELIRENYLAETKDEIKLTPAGEREARRIIRAHRLSERLFTDVLDLPLPSIEPNACAFEHFLNPDVVDSICTLLGHPKECPHGRQIPPGPCCAKARHEVKSIVIPLSEIKSGSEAKVAYIATKHHQRLDQLTALGLIPGAVIRVHQTKPAYVVKIGETDIALDTEVIEDIYVRATNQKTCS
ncbi:MAG: metal-dependent transcriptional regulator [Planctomycetes bacterium]|nr:metal-dependent transcriptional regulator [Planctomycetota bacterium]